VGLCERTAVFRSSRIHQARVTASTG
jgi:hypothetical protein